jgi:hypothetical protein
VWGDLCRGDPSCCSGLIATLGNPAPTSISPHPTQADRLVKVQDQDYYGVLIGAAGMVNHYHGLKRSPNCELVFDPSKGPNQGSLMLKVRTRNGAGIAAKAPCSSHRRLSQSLGESGWRLFRGTMATGLAFVASSVHCCC